MGDLAARWVCPGLVQLPRFFLDNGPLTDGVGFLDVWVVSGGQWWGWRSSCLVSKMVLILVEDGSGLLVVPLIFTRRARRGRFLITIEE